MDEFILRAIEDLYDVEGLRFVSKITEGYLSNNFILESRGKKFFLKQYRYDDLEKIREIHQVKFFFAKGGIPVILPLSSAANEYIFEFGKKYYSLFPFIAGRIIRRINRSERAFASAGEMLARIHLLSKDGHPDILHSYFNLWDKDEFFKELAEIKGKITSLEPATDFDKLAHQAMSYKAELVEKSTISFEDLGLRRDHIIHGDYHGNNIFYDDSDNVQWVFDIEKANIAPRSFEIARCVDFMCFANSFEEENFVDANCFLAAYSAVYPIERKELGAGFTAFYLKGIHSLWVEREHYLDKNFRVDHFLESDIEKTRYYTEHLKEFINKLEPNVSTSAAVSV